MEKTAVKVRRYLMVSSILTLAVSVAGCGGSSGGERPGSGGTPAGGTSAGGGTTQIGGTPSGGTTTPTGGTTSAGGTTGAAGTSGTPSGTLCPPGVAPTAAEITNFTSTEWNGITQKFGKGTAIGGIFSYGGGKTGSTMTSSVDSTNHTLVLSGSVVAGDYAGGGLSFDECVNASAYSGVQFTLGGTTGGCDLIFNVQTFDEKPPGTNQVGGCTSNCYVFPNAKLTSTSGAMTVSFSTLTGGQLIVATALQNEVVGLQWQFQSPAPVGDGGQPGCTGINLTITNVSFVQ